MTNLNRLRVLAGNLITETAQCAALTESFFSVDANKEELIKMIRMISQERDYTIPKGGEENVLFLIQRLISDKLRNGSYIEEVFEKFGERALQDVPF